MLDVLNDESFAHEGPLKLVLGVVGAAHGIEVVAQELGEIRLALSEVCREDENPVSSEDTA